MPQTTSICESLIKQGISPDCANPLIKGLEPDGVIINRSDIDFANCVVTGNVVSALVLKDGAWGYPVTQMGATPFTGTQSTMTSGTYRNTWQHNVAIAVLDNGPSVAENVIDALANGTFVVILRNKFKGADGRSEFQVYGYYQGLHASAIDEDKYSEDLDGGWLVTLQETASPKSAMFLWNQSYVNTKLIWDALFEGEGESEGE